jgi:hypothetical protein
VNRNLQWSLCLLPLFDISDKMQCEEGRKRRWEFCFMQKLLTVEKDKDSHYSVITKNSYCKL